MLFRLHRGGLAESMATVRWFDSVEEVKNHVVEHLISAGYKTHTGRLPTVDDILIRSYGGADTRIGWKDVHIVTAKEWGVVGFTDGPDA